MYQVGAKSMHQKFATSLFYSWTQSQQDYVSKTEGKVKDSDHKTPKDRCTWRPPPVSVVGPSPGLAPHIPVPEGGEEQSTAQSEVA